MCDAAAMAARKRSLRVWLVSAAVAFGALLLFAPGVLAGGAGRLLGEIWVTAMGAVISLFGAMFGR
jgi:uncharacterized membrane protein